MVLFCNFRNRKSYKIRAYTVTGLISSNHKKAYDLSTKLTEELSFFEAKFKKRDEVFDNLAQAFDNLTQEIERIKATKSNSVMPVDPFGDIINIDAKYATRDETKDLQGQLESLKAKVPTWPLNY